jgi:hypothetical protein
MRATLANACLIALCCACGGPAPSQRTDAAGVAPVDSDAVPADPEVSDAAVADAGAADAGAPDAGAPDAGPARAAGPTLAGCPMFPSDNPWNRDISGEPADPHSTDYLAFMGAGSLLLHPDFGGPYGQPFAIVPGTQARVPMSFLYTSQSDPGPYPFPPDVPIPGGDRHAIVLDQGACALYETYNTYPEGGGFHADSGARFDLVSGLSRPDGWTSANAAGLPILPGLARYDEAVEKGEILHALAFIVSATAHAYVAPATHSTGTSDAPWAPPMGLRVRLRADYDLSRFHGASLVVLRALQRYGMFLTDNAGLPFWALLGAQDSRWPLQDLEQLKSVPASAFEVVTLPPLKRGL